MKRDNEKVNGKIKNDIIEKLGLKTTNIEVEISEDGQTIKTELWDRGEFIFKFEEKNYKYIELKNIKFKLLYLNRSAKYNFSLVMGITPVNYGSVVPAKNEYIRKIDEIESNPEALKAIISAPDYFLDSYKKARLVGRVIKILVDEYGLVIDKKYNKFVEVYYNEIIKYRNALGHAMRSNEHADREVFIGEIDKTPLIFTEDLFRQMRASLNEYQQVINLVENSFNQI